MFDDPSKKFPRDASRIDMNENYEVRYWTDKFGVTADELSEAVRRVGTTTRDVEAVLMEKRRK